MKIYLSRPFTSCRVGDIIGYYYNLSLALNLLGHEAIIPLTDDFNNVNLQDHIIGENEGHDPVAHNTNKGIVRRDYFMLSQSDMLIADYSIPAKSNLFGMTMELAWAWQLRKHTIVIKDKDKFNSPFIDQCADVIVTTVSEALEYLNIINLKV